MTALETTEENTIPTKILQQLSRSAYACSSLSPLSSRDGNFVYRGILAQPIHIQDGAAATSIIIKHSTDSVPKIFEELLLNSLAHFSPSTKTSTTTSTATVEAPRLYLYDRETNTQVLEDFPNTDMLRAALFPVNAADNFLSSTSTASIGYNLGAWFRSFHDWARAPDQAALRAQIWRNDHMRKTKYQFTSGSILNVLENYPQLLESHEKTLRAYSDYMATESEWPSTEEAEGFGLIHGDLWSGNILIRTSPSPREDTTNELFIIDWEFAQFGHRSTDLGQILGDLYEKKIYNNLDNAISVMEAVIKGYGALDSAMAFRTAMYVGAHLISYYNRRPRKGPRAVSPEVLEAGLRVGRDFIVKAWEKDRAFFDGTALASLFAGI